MDFPLESPIFCAVEGMTDETVLRRLLEKTRLSMAQFRRTGGKDRLRHQAPGYNQDAYRTRWIVLTDLDREPSACTLRQGWLLQVAPLMCFRVAVRALEAWLLADQAAVASYLGVDPTKIPLSPDTLSDPKETFVALARRSRKPFIRRELVPTPGSGMKVGPAYSSRLIEFAQSHWRPEVAAASSDSLRRCRLRLRELAQGG